MPRHTLASLLALFCTCACTLPAAALSQSDGGAAYGNARVAPASGPGGTLLVRTAVRVGNALHVKGTMAHGAAGRPVTVQRQMPDGSWTVAATATTTSGGAFDATWRTDHTGRYPLRAVPATRARATAAATSATGETPVSVYRQAEATFFGPGFFGQRTACGQTLERSTVGVAHRSLPCGTLVALFYKGRTVTVPVIDRGPFRAGTTWDLTSATAEALRFADTGRVGALRVRDTAKRR